MSLSSDSDMCLSLDQDVSTSTEGGLNLSSEYVLSESQLPCFNASSSNDEGKSKSKNAFIFGPPQGTQYQLGRRIGSGNYGVVRLGKIVGTRDFVAVKLEPTSSFSTTIAAAESELEKEWKIYCKLGTIRGFPKAHFFGPITFPDKNVFNGLVISLLDLNLEDLFDIRRRKFSLKTILMIALETLSRIEQLHCRGLLYRDIKPANFMVGRDKTPEEDLLHIVDFGLCQEYLDPTTGNHIAMDEDVAPAGTIRFMSINCHKRRQQSRRDDLEALGYLYVYFMIDKLPWSDMAAKDDSERFSKIGQKKETMPIETLCKGMPEEFAIYLKTVRELAFKAEPDYEFLKNLFRGLLTKKGWKFDRAWDWKGKLPHKTKSSKSSFLDTGIVPP